MSKTIHDFDFSQLSTADRILLAQELWDSVHDEAEAMPLTAAEREELDRRFAQLESGTVQGIPWERVRQSLFSK